MFKFLRFPSICECKVEAAWPRGRGVSIYGTLAVRSLQPAENTLS